jgi:hypothetical protein
MSPSLYISAQAIGLLGMAVDVYASLHKKDRNLKKIASLASYIMSLHFFLLGALPGALSELLNGTRTVLSIYTRSRFLAFSFLGFYAIVLLTVPDNLIETLPFISSLSITAGLYFYQGISMRLFNLAGWICWLIYSISVFSIGGIIVFSILLVTTTITIFRLRRDNNVIGNQEGF